MAASLLVEGRGALSHQAAARILGLPLPRWQLDNPTIEVTYLRRVRPEVTPVRAHESNVLTADDIVTAQHIRVTGAVFTIGALATRLGEFGTARLLDAAVAEGLVTAGQVATLSSRLWACPGVPNLRKALELHRPAIELTSSERERRMFRVIRDAGLPLPEVNLRQRDSAGRTRYLDFAWQPWRVWGEFDSDRYHGSTMGRRDDGRRQNDLVVFAGERWTPLRFDDRDLLERPEQVVSTIRRTLNEVGAHIDSVPPI